MLRLVRDFPEARSVRPDVLRAFREIDPQIEVLHLGPRRWMLGRVHDGSEAGARQRRMGDARVKLARQFSGKRLRDRTWHERQWFARAMQQGFEGLHEWTADELTHEHVERFRACSYLQQNLRSDALAQFDAEAEAKRAADEADLTDKHRAHDAHRYAFTRSHAVTAKYDVQTRSSVVRDITPPKPAA